jgi:hypothetical protein
MLRYIGGGLNNTKPPSSHQLAAKVLVTERSRTEKIQDHVYKNFQAAVSLICPFVHLAVSPSPSPSPHTQQQQQQQQQQPSRLQLTPQIARAPQAFS